MEKKSTETVMETEIELGEAVRVTDPCYDLGVWCTIVVEDVLPGKYKARVVKLDDDRIWSKDKPAYLIVEHSNYDSFEYNERIIGEVGVDSGQAGIFDEEYYKKIYENEKDENGEETKEYEDWYDRCFYQGYIEKPNPNYMSEERWAFTNFPEEVEELVNKGENPLMASYEVAKKHQNEYYESDARWFNIVEYGISNLDNKGACSCTNYGDGGYDLYVARNEDGKVIGFKIDFVGDLEDYEEEGVD
jgi:hypothetical protein